MLVDPQKLVDSWGKLPFFLLVTEKDEKTCFYGETNDFEKQLSYGAHVHWSKYTTDTVSGVTAFNFHACFCSVNLNNNKNNLNFTILF